VCQLNSLVYGSVFWISWSLKLGLIGFPEMSVQNYHSTLPNISLEHRPHVIWWCRPWFGSTWSASEPSGFGAVWYSASYMNLIGPDMFKPQISGKNLSLYSNEYRIYCIHILLIGVKTETKVENRQSNFLWCIWRRKFDSAPIFY